MSIYKDFILDHYHNQTYRGKLNKYSIKKMSANPSCGDKVTFYILIEKNKIKKISYISSGCVISQAAASILAAMVDQQPITKISQIKEKQLIDKFGLNKYSSRLKCVLLPFQTVKKILNEINK